MNADVKRSALYMVYADYSWTAIATVSQHLDKFYRSAKLCVMFKRPESQEAEDRESAKQVAGIAVAVFLVGIYALLTKPRSDNAKSVVADPVIETGPEGPIDAFQGMPSFPKLDLERVEDPSKPIDIIVPKIPDATETDGEVVEPRKLEQ